MGNIILGGGAWKTCPICGKYFFVPNCSDWVYKRWYKRRDWKIEYFCKWSCMRRYDKEHDGEQSKMRSEAAVKGHKKRKAKEKKNDS